MEPAVDGQIAVAAVGPQGAHGGDGCGHTGPARQPRLGRQPHASLQRQRECVEAVQERGRSRGESFRASVT